MSLQLSTDQQVSSSTESQPVQDDPSEKKSSKVSVIDGIKNIAFDEASQAPIPNKKITDTRRVTPSNIKDNEPFISKFLSLISHHSPQNNFPDFSEAMKYLRDNILLKHGTNLRPFNLFLKVLFAKLEKENAGLLDKMIWYCFDNDHSTCRHIIWYCIQYPCSVSNTVIEYILKIHPEALEPFAIPCTRITTPLSDSILTEIFVYYQEIGDWDGLLNFAYGCILDEAKNGNCPEVAKQAFEILLRENSKHATSLANSCTTAQTQVSQDIVKIAYRKILPRDPEAARSFTAYCMKGTNPTCREAYSSILNKPKNQKEPDPAAPPRKSLHQRRLEKSKTG